VQYVTLMSQAKEEMLQGRATEALLSYQQAALVYPSIKVHAKIQKLQVLLTGPCTQLLLNNLLHCTYICLYILQSTP
jgi:hypothetical protein